MIAILFACSSIANVEEYGATIRQAELMKINNWYVLAAEIPIKLSPVAHEALQNSISQVWELRVRLLKRRPYIWDENIFTENFRFRIRYHPLLKMYQVKHENNGKIVSFSTLGAAFNTIESINGLKIIKQSQLQSPENYSVAVKMQFINEELPLPLRPFSYFKPGWNLSSDWLQWRLQK
jgi:hypothetical protein